MEVIKKYTNRKLYSTKAKAYVTLEYIQDLVRTKQTFQIVCNSTKKDLTNEVLKQSLLLLNINNSTLETLIRQ